MSFPHRTWFYDRNENELIDPEESASDMIIIDPRGERSEGKKAGRLTKDINCYILRGKHIPLASTGLEDSEGREIIEGHILQQNFDGEPFATKRLIYYDDGAFCIMPSSYSSSRVRQDNTGSYEIIGHCLVDPDLVPDEFNVEEYFDLNNS